MSEQSMPRVRAPSAASVREQINRFVELWLGAMFLKREDYAYEREQKNPFGNGLVYIAVIGIILTLAGMLGAALRYATSPTPDAIKNTVLVHLQAMPFYNALSPEAMTQFEQGFDNTWDSLGSLFVGYPTDTAGVVSLAATILTTPLGLALGWLLYGALVHLVARGWNPETSFGEMLAPLALASSPQLLNLFSVFPAVSVSGVVIALWTLVCNIVAIRVAYQTTTRRAVWGALFPILVLSVLLLILGIIAMVSFASIVRAITGGAQ